MGLRLYQGEGFITKNTEIRNLGYHLEYPTIVEPMHAATGEIVLGEQ